MSIQSMFTLVFNKLTCLSDKTFGPAKLPFARNCYKLSYVKQNGLEKIVHVLCIVSVKSISYHLLFDLYLTYMDFVCLALFNHIHFDVVPDLMAHILVKMRNAILSLIIYVLLIIRKHVLSTY